MKFKIEKDDIYIKGNVASKKNSKRWIGKALIDSKAVDRYLKLYNYQWSDEQNIKKFKNLIKDLPQPYNIGFYFIRQTIRAFDYNNISQLPQDLMVKYGWLEDDNCNILKPVYLGYEKDKDNAGIIIRVLKNEIENGSE